MSPLQELLDAQTTDISQSSTSNLTSPERVRYLDRSRKSIADRYDWPFFNKNAELAVTLQGTEELYATAPLPADIKSYRLRSITDVASELDFEVLEENEFRASSGRCCTIGRDSETDEIQIKGVSGSEADDDAFLADQATSSASTTVVTDLLTSPDVPRRVVITPGGTTADIAAGNVAVVGTDMNGSVLSENIALTANQTAVSTSTGFFKTITSITFPIMDGNGATFDVGTNSVVGLKIEYIRKLTAYSPDTPDLSQESEFPDEMDEVIVLGSVYRILMKFNRDSAMIATYKTEYNEALEAAWSTYQGRIKGATKKIVNIRQTRFRPVATNRYR